MTNAKFAQTNDLFLHACLAAKVLPTSRQASRFRSGKGSAFQALKTSDLVLAKMLSWRRGKIEDAECGYGQVDAQMHDDTLTLERLGRF